MFQEFIDFKNQLESIINGKKRVQKAIIKEEEKIESYKWMSGYINDQIYKIEPDLEENYSLLMEQFKEMKLNYKARIQKAKEHIAELRGLLTKQENTLHVYYETANFQMDWDVIRALPLKQRITFLDELMSLIKSMPLIEPDEVYEINKKFIPLYENCLESKKNTIAMLQKENSILKKEAKEAYLDMLKASVEDIIEPSGIGR